MNADPNVSSLFHGVLNLQIIIMFVVVAMSWMFLVVAISIMILKLINAKY